MQTIYRLLICCILANALSLETFAQRSAILNYGNLIAAMPETREADTELKAYEQSLIAKGEEMAKKFTADVDAYYKKIEQGLLSPSEQEKMGAELEKKQNDIKRYESEITQKLEIKRSALLAPLVEKTTNAINAIARENLLSAVFDVSVFNAVLYAADGYDLEKLVTNRLGIAIQNSAEYIGGVSAIAYVNSTAILSKLPDVKKVYADLETLQKQLQKKGQRMADQLSKDMAFIQQKSEKGELSTEEREIEVAKFQKRQNEITKFEEDMVPNLEDKRKKYFKPILEKVDNAIAAIAKENNLQLIFEQGILLYADEKLEVTHLVLQQLGLSGTGTFKKGGTSFGVANSAEILSTFPDVKQADANLEALQKQLQKKREGMTDQLNKDIALIQQKVENGELSPKEQEIEAAKFQERLKEIEKLEKEMVAQLEDKRNEYFKPILEKVNNAIKKAAIENNLSFVFDSGVILYKNPTMDVSEIVKKNLGL